MGYKTDMNEQEWLLIEEVSPVHKIGRPREYGNREIMNAIRYQQHTGCQWDMLPNDFPPHGVVQHHFYEWRNNGLFEKMQKKLHAMLRKKQCRKEEPSLAIIDSQSVKTGQKGGSVAMMLERKSKVESDISPSMLQGI